MVTITSIPLPMEETEIEECECDDCFEKLIKIYEKPFFPRIVVVDDSIWTMKAEEGSEEVFKWLVRYESRPQILGSVLFLDGRLKFK